MNHQDLMLVVLGLIGLVLVIVWFLNEEPKFCPECGTRLVIAERPGPASYSNEWWKVLECPHYYNSTGVQHYHQIVSHRPKPDNFNRHTGKKR